MLVEFNSIYSFCTSETIEMRMSQIEKSYMTEKNIILFGFPYSGKILQLISKIRSFASFEDNQSSGTHFFCCSVNQWNVWINICNCAVKFAWLHMIDVFLVWRKKNWIDLQFEYRKETVPYVWNKIKMCKPYQRSGTAMQLKIMNLSAILFLSYFVK